MANLANMIVAVYGDPVCFAVDHRVDDAVYQLAENQRYKITIRKQLKDDWAYSLESETAAFDFDCPAELTPGDYYFEISLVTLNDNDVSTERVISPAADERGVRLNCFSVVRNI